MNRSLTKPWPKAKPTEQDLRNHWPWHEKTGVYYKQQCEEIKKLLIRSYTVAKLCSLLRDVI